MEARPPGIVALFGGAAGAGKSTLALRWCATRPFAVHLQLDDVRHLIVSGRADPQEPTPLQAEQYVVSVEACCALARAFATRGYDAAIDDVFEPEPFARFWLPHFSGLDWRLAVVHPSLGEVLARGAARQKQVQERHVRAQHAASAAWPASHRVDTTGIGAEESLPLVSAVLDLPPPEIPVMR